MGAQLVKPKASSIPRMPIYYEEFTARNFNTSPLTISGLLGDTYDYTLVVTWSDVSTGVPAIDLNVNSDTGSNYRRYRMNGGGSSASANVSDSDTDIPLFWNVHPSSDKVMTILNITGSSGDERYFEGLQTWSSSGSTNITKVSFYWKNTVDELTSLSIDSTVSATNDATVALFATPKETSSENWELVEEKTFTNQDLSTNPLDFNNLDGDVDIKYKLSCYQDNDVIIRPNNSTTANITRQILNNNGGTLQAANSTSLNRLQLDFDQGDIIINAETGQERLFLTSGSKQGATRDQAECAHWWGDTSTNLTSIRYMRLDTTLTTGTAKLYRIKNPNTVADRFNLPFKHLKTVDVSGDFSAGHTFSGLEGDSVLCYKLEWLGSNTSAAMVLRMRINGDTGSNYVEQRLRGNNVTTSALNTTQTYFDYCWVHNGDESVSEMYLYPKSGENRPYLSRFALDEDQLDLRAGWWENSVDEITSIDVYASNTNSMSGQLKLSYIPLPEV